jgi:hypothetical protein
MAESLRRTERTVLEIRFGAKDPVPVRETADDQIVAEASDRGVGDHFFS